MTGGVVCECCFGQMLPWPSWEPLGSWHQCVHCRRLAELPRSPHVLARPATLAAAGELRRDADPSRPSLAPTGGPGRRICPRCSVTLQRQLSVWECPACRFVEPVALPCPRCSAVDRWQLVGQDNICASCGYPGADNRPPVVPWPGRIGLLPEHPRAQVALAVVLLLVFAGACGVLALLW